MGTVSVLPFGQSPVTKPKQCCSNPLSVLYHVSVLRERVISVGSKNQNNALQLIKREHQNRKKYGHSIWYMLSERDGTIDDVVWAFYIVDSLFMIVV